MPLDFVSMLNGGTATATKPINQGLDFVKMLSGQTLPALPIKGVDQALNQQLQNRGNTPAQISSLAPSATPSTFSLENTAEASDKFLQGTGQVMSFPFQVINAGEKALGANATLWAQYLSGKGNKTFEQAYKEAPTAGGMVANTLQDLQGIIRGNKTTLDYFMPEFLGQIADAGVGAVVLGGVGTELANRYVSIKITPEQLNGSKPIPQAHADIASKLFQDAPQNVIDQVKENGLEIKIQKPAGGVRGVIGEQVLGGQTENAHLLVKIPNFTSESPLIQEIKSVDNFEQFLQDTMKKDTITPQETQKLSEIEQYQKNEIQSVIKEMQSSGALDFQGQQQSNYDRFVEIVKNPKLLNPKFKEIIQSSDVQAFKDIAKRLGVYNPKNEDIFGLGEGDTHTFELFKARLIKENPNLLATNYAGTNSKQRIASSIRQQNTIKKLKEIVVNVSRSQLPVGTGETKVSKLEARVQDTLNNVPQETIDKLGLSTYQQMNKKENIASASDYVIKNPEEALKVLTGEKEPPPGILRNSIYVAMQNEAVGNVELARKLASIGSTRLGQELSILTEIDPNSPVKLMSDVVKLREQQFKKTGGSRNKIVKDISGEIAKATPKIKDWVSFIESIKCK